MSEVTTQAEFDINKSYGWSPEDLFPLKGNEFGILYNTLATMINSEGFKEELDKANRTIATYRLYEVMKGVLKSGVEQGVATEATAPEQPTEAVQ